MQFLFLIVPLGLFFTCYVLFDIYVGTLALMASTVAMVALEWLLKRKVAKMHLATTGLLLVFGSLTVFLQDPGFIKWKVSIVNWLFAAGFFGSQLFAKRPAIQSFMEAAFNAELKEGEEAKPLPLSNRSWHWYNFSVGAFFALVGFVNLFIAFNYATDVWVKFKVFGTLGMTLVFFVGLFSALSYQLSAADKASDNSP